MKDFSRAVTIFSSSCLARTVAPGSNGTAWDGAASGRHHKRIKSLCRRPALWRGFPSVRSQTIEANRNYVTTGVIFIVHVMPGEVVRHPSHPMTSAIVPSPCLLNGSTQKSIHLSGYLESNYGLEEIMPPRPNVLGFDRRIRRSLPSSSSS